MAFGKYIMIKWMVWCTLIWVNSVADLGPLLQNSQSSVNETLKFQMYCVLKMQFFFFFAKKLEESPNFLAKKKKKLMVL